MTEKHYGGSSSFGFKEKPEKTKNSALEIKNKKQKKMEENEESYMDEEKLVEAGKIAKQVREYALSIAKKDMLLIELAEKIESKVYELGAKPAFPVNLSIDEIAAHDTPAHNDERKTHGLLKIDIGVHIDGFVADTAISVDLENSEINKKLIDTAKKCLESAKKTVSSKISLGELGKNIEQSAKEADLLTIRNLTGHLIEEYDLHAGVSIPNYDTKQEQEIGEGVYAIEPFVTNGQGLVKDSKPSGIYVVQKPGNIRDNFAREVLSYILDEYVSLPFCSRWIVKKFGTRALIALKQIENAGILHQYAQLTEAGKGLVAQAEHTFIIKDNEVIITTD